MNNLEIVDQPFEKSKEYDRSILHTIVCIASFIGCWLTILYYAIYINKVSGIERSVYHIDEGGILEYLLMKISIIASLVSFIGTVFMWRMRRFGIFIYAAGQLVPAGMGAYIALMVNDVEIPKTYLMLGHAAIQVLFICLFMISWEKMRWNRT